MIRSAALAALAALAATLGLGAGAASAAIVQISPAADNTLYENLAGALSNGSGSFLFAGVTDTFSSNVIRRALLRFDVAGNVPAGATINAATLTLRVTREPESNPGPSLFSLHPVTQAWGEGTSDAAGNEGPGAASTSGDATWLHTFFDTSTWTTPGGDFGAASATQAIDDANQFYSFASATMADEVQDWLDTPANNFGWILIGDEAGTTNARQFPSRENATPANRPVLTLDYSVPAADAVDHYVRYAVAAAKLDGNAFPKKDFNLTLNDASVDDLEPDDPENYQVRKEKGLLLPAEKNNEGDPSDPLRHYIRYQIKEAKEGIGAGSPGDFPKAVKALARRWNLTNQFGSLSVDAKKVTALLLPAAMDPNSVPAALAADETHYICYQVKPSKDVSSDQAPAGKFRKDLQAYFGDGFTDCATDYAGNVAFATTVVEGKCLLNLAKPVELCSPASKTAVAGGRFTVASIADSMPSTTEALLCYKSKLASKLTSTGAATLIGGQVGEKIAKQAKHAKRRLKDGSQLFAAPSNNFPAPAQIDTNKTDAVCIPTTVDSIDPL